MNKKYKWPLMVNNITKADRQALIKFLSSKDCTFTNGPKVLEFERKWSEWLGVKYSVFVNSGASANLLTLKAYQWFQIMPNVTDYRWMQDSGFHSITRKDSLFRFERKGNEIIVPAFTWPSCIMSVINAGFKPVFADIDPRTLSLDNKKVMRAVGRKTVAVFVTHAQGFSGISPELHEFLNQRRIHLIEDVCESHGAHMEGARLGTLGLMSNFSFYYGHHMTTIEGGMICTNSESLYNTLLMLRSHGMTRETAGKIKYKSAIDERPLNFREASGEMYPDLNPDFIFEHPGFNMRNTELGAVLGINQLKRLDKNNEKRRRNFRTFLKYLDPELYWTDFAEAGSCNYAFNIVLKTKNKKRRGRLIKALDNAGIEYRAGSVGGGNQLLQPYAEKIIGFRPYLAATVHVHQYGFYTGNYPSIKETDVKWLCDVLNSIK